MLSIMDDFFLGSQKGDMQCTDRSYEAIVGVVSLDTLEHAALLLVEEGIPRFLENLRDDDTLHSTRDLVNCKSDQQTQPHNANVV